MKKLTGNTLIHSKMGRSCLDISSTKIEYKSFSAIDIFNMLYSIILFIGAFYIIFKVAASNTPFFENLTELTFVLAIFILPAVGLGYGRKITVDFQSLTIKDEKLFLWFVCSYEEHKLVGVGRQAGETSTDPDQLYAETKEGERIILMKLNGWKMDDTWKTVKEKIEDQFLIQNK